MTGDDVGGAEWVIPGFALHREFDEFAAAGVPPLHVLQDATLNPAEYLGTTSTMGTVDEGKNADLVLLDENPLASVQNLHKIYAVVRAGHYFSRQELDSIEALIAAKQARLVAVH
jgi:imidazolonepropionase-like amidohydrolase